MFNKCKYIKLYKTNQIFSNIFLIFLQMVEYKEVDSKVLNRILNNLNLKNPVSDLVKSTKYTKGTISQYLSGAKKPSYAFIKSIEEVYNIELIKDTADSPPQSEPQIVKEPAPRYVKNDAKPSRRGDDSLYYTNKNGINFYINDETIQRHQSTRRGI